MAKSQHKRRDKGNPGIQSDPKMYEDFNKRQPNINDPDFQKPNPNINIPNFGDFYKEDMDETIIGKIDGRDNNEREDEPENKR